MKNENGIAEMLKETKKNNELLAEQNSLLKSLGAQPMPNGKVGGNGDTRTRDPERGGKMPGEGDPLYPKKVADWLMEKALKIKNAGSPDVMPSLSQLAAKIVSRFGGLDGFVDSWFGQFKTALETRPGAVSNLQHFNQIAKIISEAQKHEREDELANMTMEQIEQEQRRLMMMDLIQSLGEEAKGELSRKILGIVGSKNQEPLPIDGTVEVVHE